MPSPRQGAGVEGARRRAEREVRDEVRAHTSGLVGLIGEEIVVVVRPEVADRCSRRILERLSTSCPSSGPGIGVSDPHGSLGDLETAYREALTAAAVSEKISHKLVRFTDLGLYRLFFDAQHADRVEEYIDRWLEPLLRYDAAHRTQLVETLACHLSGAGRAEVAAKLSIHPSTLKYRLRRIREIFGIDFVDTESRFNIELALRLVQVTRDLRASGQHGSPIGQEER
jgi:DNA-binding PucR family transcriptional regulator